MIYLSVDKLLENSGQTTYWLVRQLNSSYSVVNNMLSRKPESIRLSMIEKLCRIFDCKPNDLFTIVEDPPV